MLNHKAATVNFDRLLVDFESTYPQYLGCIYGVFDTDDKGVIEDNGIYIDELATRRYGVDQKDIWQGFNKVINDRLGFVPDTIRMVSPNQMYVEAS